MNYILKIVCILIVLIFAPLFWFRINNGLKSVYNFEHIRIFFFDKDVKPFYPIKNFFSND